jgi:hypothetical protein
VQTITFCKVETFPISSSNRPIAFNMVEDSDSDIVEVEENTKLSRKSKVQVIGVVHKLNHSPHVLIACACRCSELG